VGCCGDSDESANYLVSYRDLKLHLSKIDSLFSAGRNYTCLCACSLFFLAVRFYLWTARRIVTTWFNLLSRDTQRNFQLLSECQGDFLPRIISSFISRSNPLPLYFVVYIKIYSMTSFFKLGSYVTSVGWVAQSV
jgi:hypothetical protein